MTKYTGKVGYRVVKYWPVCELYNHHREEKRLKKMVGRPCQIVLVNGHIAISASTQLLIDGLVNTLYIVEE